MTLTLRNDGSPGPKYVAIVNLKIVALFFFFVLFCFLIEAFSSVSLESPCCSGSTELHCGSTYDNVLSNLDSCCCCCAVA